MSSMIFSGSFIYLLLFLDNPLWVLKKIIEKKKKEITFYTVPPILWGHPHITPFPIIYDEHPLFENIKAPVIEIPKETPEEIPDEISEIDRIPSLETIDLNDSILEKIPTEKSIGSLIPSDTDSEVSWDIVSQSSTSPMENGVYF